MVPSPVADTALGQGVFHRKSAQIELVSATEVKRSIDKGDHDEDRLSGLQNKWDCGKAAERLAEATDEQRINITVHGKMKTDLDMLTKSSYSITENVARFWAAQVGEHELSKEKLDLFVDIARPWMLKDEFRSEESADFSLDAPRLW